MKEMPEYLCHKRVRALKIREVICHADPGPAVSVADFAKTAAFEGGHLFFEDESYGPLSFDAAFYRKHEPSPGGYYVVYENGYASWSPADAFEAGYTRVDG